LIGVFVVGIYAFGHGRSMRYWSLALLPSLIWLLIGFVNFGFDGFLALTLQPDEPATHWQDWLWLSLLILAIISMIRAKVDRRFLIIQLWTSFGLGLPILLSGNFTGMDSIAVYATIALGSVLGLQTLTGLSSHYRAWILITIFTALLIIAPPQTPD